MLRTTGSPQSRSRRRRRRSPAARGPPAPRRQAGRDHAQIAEQKVDQALVDALRWRAEQPGNVMALVALGEALQAHGNIAAGRAGLRLDHRPVPLPRRHAALRRRAARGPGPGGAGAGRGHLQQAVEQRPDHQSEPPPAGLRPAAPGPARRGLRRAGGRAEAALPHPPQRRRAHPARGPGPGGRRLAGQGAQPQGRARDQRLAKHGAPDWPTRPACASCSPGRPTPTTWTSTSTTARAATPTTAQRSLASRRARSSPT